MGGCQNELLGSTVGFCFCLKMMLRREKEARKCQKSRRNQVTNGALLFLGGKRKRRDWVRTGGEESISQEKEEFLCPKEKKQGSEREG